MNNSESAASIMLQIGPLTIGNTVVTAWGVMLMFLLPCHCLSPYLTLTGLIRPIAVIESPHKWTFKSTLRLLVDSQHPVRI
jgi:hypothetical protein